MAVTAGNAHDSIAWDEGYNNVLQTVQNTEFAVMDSAYKTAWISKKILDDGRIPIMPYTRFKGRKEGFRPWDYECDAKNDCHIYPRGKVLRHTTANRDRVRSCRGTPKICKDYLCREKCGANEKGQKLFTGHIWQGHLDLVEQLRKTPLGKEMYAQHRSPCLSNRKII